MRLIDVVPLFVASTVAWHLLRQWTTPREDTINEFARELYRLPFS